MPYLSALKSRNFHADKAGQKATIFILILSAHIGIIILLMISWHITPPKKQGSLSAFSLSASASSPSVPVPARAVLSEVKPILLNPVEAFAEQEQGAKGNPDGDACAPLDLVRTQLTSDPTLPDAINMVPRADRSISEAIVIWNAEWSVTAASDEAPLGRVRNSIQTTLANMSQECLEIPVAGPRLIPIEMDGSTVFLAFGSGEWRWQQLIEPQIAPSSMDGEWTWDELFEAADLPVLLVRERQAQSAE